jgi:thiol:disulfide interchange protein DsbA
VAVPVVWSPANEPLARFHYMLLALGREDLRQVTFDAVHRGDAGITTDDPQRVSATIGPLQEFAGAHGIAARKFSEIFYSPDITARVQHAQELCAGYNVQAVPTFVVNGKYSTNAVQAGGQERLIELLNDLTMRERMASAAGAR